MKKASKKADLKQDAKMMDKKIKEAEKKDKKQDAKMIKSAVKKKK